MWWLIKGILGYRAEIWLAIQLLKAVRKHAREITREYIHNLIRQRLKRQILVVGIEGGLLLIAYALTSIHPSLGNRLYASCVLWGITLYNVGDLLFGTIPELIEVHRVLKSKVGYALKYFLEISLVTECLRLNIVFLFVCLVLVISTRTALGAIFSYWRPWVELFAL